MARRLFANLEIDWERLRLPALDSCENPLAGQGLALSLATFREEHLRSLPALRVLYCQAVARGVLTDSEANFIAFLSTAAHCLRVGVRPAALFAFCLRERRFDMTSLVDEDQACQALKRALAEELSQAGWLTPKPPQLKPRRLARRPHH